MDFEYSKEIMNERGNWMKMMTEEIQKRKDEGTLLLDVNEKYPLNKTRLQEWVKSHDGCDEEIRIFVENVIAHTKYISHQSFIKAFQECIENFIYEFIKIKKDNPNAYWVLYRGWSQNKSNNWLATLLIYFLINIDAKDYYPLFVSTKDDFNFLPSFSFTDFVNDFNDPNAYIVCCDDASYSGQQLSSALMHFNQKYNLMVIIPFITQQAMKKITDTSDNITIFFHEYLKTAKEYLEDINYYQNLSIGDIYSLESKLAKEFKTDSVVLANTVPVYFDHKIADYVSSFPTIYGSGESANCSDQTFTFIDNCIPLKKRNVMMGTLKGHSCAEPFYKSSLSGGFGNQRKYMDSDDDIRLFMILEKYFNKQIVYKGHRYKLYRREWSPYEPYIIVKNRKLYLLKMKPEKYKVVFGEMNPKEK